MLLGYIYLLHFLRPLGNLANRRAMAQHYLGWALDPEERNAVHLAGQGAAITRAAVEAGISWELYVLGPGDRALESLLKKKVKAAPRLCPICGIRHPRGPYHVPPATLQLPLFDADPFDVPAPAWRIDGYEIVKERAWRAARAIPVGEFTGQIDCVGIPF